MHKILAIDPGSQTTGYAILSDKAKVLHSGYYVNSPKLDVVQKCLDLYNHFYHHVIPQFSPTEAIIEDQFFLRVHGFKTLIMAKTAILLACAKWGLTITQYNPASVKKYFKTKDKLVIRDQIESSLSIRIDAPLDVSDAIALGLYHLSQKHQS